MRKFLTEVLGKRMITSDGSMVGTIEDLTIDEGTGDLLFVVVLPDGEALAYFATDDLGRAMIPFKEMRSVRDVVVMDID